MDYINMNNVEFVKVAQIDEKIVAQYNFVSGAQETKAFSSLEDYAKFTDERCTRAAGA